MVKGNSINLTWLELNDMAHELLAIDDICISKDRLNQIKEYSEKVKSRAMAIDIFEESDDEKFHFTDIPCGYIIHCNKKSTYKHDMSGLCEEHSKLFKGCKKL